MCVCGGGGDSGKKIIIVHTTTHNIGETHNKTEEQASELLKNGSKCTKNIFLFVL